MIRAREGTAAGGAGAPGAREPLAGLPDPRRHAYRPDLAAESLRHEVEAPRYAPGTTGQIVRSAVPLRRRPDAGVGLDTEALYGEIVTVYDEAGGWAWVQLERDRYVGYVPADAVSPHVLEPTHRVKALGTFVYPVPEIKSPPLMHLSLNSLVTVAERNGPFCRLERGGFVVARHIVEWNRHERDYVDIAERLIGTPYLWGGRTRVGLDCSGLVQVSLEAAGIPCPRDTDMQEAEVGRRVVGDNPVEGLERGDLVFWKGHVGMMADGLMLVHANAHHMAVTIETLPEAVERIAKSGSGITAVKRLPALSG
jgi:cell wall-associated NlpC family hydrolase